MLKHAGAADKNFGHLQNWKDWYPYKGPTKWLLLSGAAKLTATSENNNNNQVFLTSLEEGFSVLMETLLTLKFDIHQFNFDCHMTKECATTAIKNLFEECMKANPQAKPVIYYGGYGCIGTGDWVFSDGLLSVEKMVSLVPKGSFYPFIIADCSYSGQWADFCVRRRDIWGLVVVAAVPYYEENVFTSRGGKLVGIMTNSDSQTNQCSIMTEAELNKSNQIQVNSAETRTGSPIYGDMWSSDEITEYPRKCISFHQLMKAHLEDSKHFNRIISFTIHRGKFSAVFAKTANTRKNGGIHTKQNISLKNICKTIKCYHAEFYQYLKFILCFLNRSNFYFSLFLF